MKKTLLIGFGLLLLVGAAAANYGYHRGDHHDDMTEVLEGGLDSLEEYREEAVGKHKPCDPEDMIHCL